MIPELSECIMCEKTSIRVVLKEEKLDYGDPREVLLDVLLPVNECKDCGFTFVGESGFKARAFAAKNYLRGKGVPEEKLTRV